MSSYTFVRRFARQQNGSYTHIGNLTIPGASLIHFLSFRGDQLYVSDVQTNAVHRFPLQCARQPRGQRGRAVCQRDRLRVQSGPGRDVGRTPLRRRVRALRASIGDRHLAVDGGDRGSVDGRHRDDRALVREFAGSGCRAPAPSCRPCRVSASRDRGSRRSCARSSACPADSASCRWRRHPATCRCSAAPGCRVRTSATPTSSCSTGPGGTTFPITIPANFTPLDLYYQSFVIDFGAANGLFSATAGLRATPQSAGRPRRRAWAWRRTVVVTSGRAPVWTRWRVSLRSLAAGEVRHRRLASPRWMPRPSPQRSRRCAVLRPRMGVTATRGALARAVGGAASGPTGAACDGRRGQRHANPVTPPIPCNTKHPTVPLLRSA